MVSKCVWRAIACEKMELRLDITLACGQSFRWKELVPGEWTSVLSGNVWTLKQDDKNIYYKIENEDVTAEPVTDSQYNEFFQKPDNILKDYFQLNYCLKDLYKKWSDADDIFKEAGSTFTGVRMLRQDPVENLFSFICSSNNHISRISGMVERMCEAYGNEINARNGKSYYTFPTVQSLSQPGVEDKLRKLGFGYRAKFINTTAKMLAEKEDDWLYSLREMPYEEAKAELMKLCGVGAKVADCVCLMSLDKLGAIPVDTHVWQIAARHYMPKLNSAKSVTPAIYNQIGNHFRTLWGELAGWAHSILFSADLKKFQDLKPDKKVPANKRKTNKNEAAGVAPAKRAKSKNKAKRSKRKQVQ